MGATAEGKKELIAVADGYRESEQSWYELLQDVKRRDLAGELSEFSKALSPCYSDSGIELSCRCIDLLWKPVSKLVRFVIVHHPQRGMIFLLSTNRELNPLEIIELYSYRFKIEVGFKQAVHTLGTYAYHFWAIDHRQLLSGAGLRMRMSPVTLRFSSCGSESFVS